MADIHVYCPTMYISWTEKFCHVKNSLANNISNSLLLYYSHLSCAMVNFVYRNKYYGGTYYLIFRISFPEK
jgi:hypothetical protein